MVLQQEPTWAPAKEWHSVAVRLSAAQDPASQMTPVAVRLSAAQGPALQMTLAVPLLLAE